MWRVQFLSFYTEPDWYIHKPSTDFRKNALMYTYSWDKLKPATRVGVSAVDLPLHCACLAFQIMFCLVSMYTTYVYNTHIHIHRDVDNIHFGTFSNLENSYWATAKQYAQCGLFEDHRKTWFQMSAQQIFMAARHSGRWKGVSIVMGVPQ